MIFYRAVESGARTTDAARTAERAGRDPAFLTVACPVCDEEYWANTRNYLTGASAEVSVGLVVPEEAPRTTQDAHFDGKAEVAAEHLRAECPKHASELNV